LLAKIIEGCEGLLRDKRSSLFCSCPSYYAIINFLQLGQGGKTSQGKTL
jgi:hypothetical protein